MQPSMPGRRHGRRLGIASVDHPAPLDMQRRINLTTARSVVAVAEFVFADGLAIHPGPELGAEGLRIPPGEDLEQETFHRAHIAFRRGWRSAISAGPCPARIGPPCSAESARMLCR